VTPPAVSREVAMTRSVRLFSIVAVVAVALSLVYF
jgi:hypothetical protein